MLTDHGLHFVIGKRATGVSTLIKRIFVENTNRKKIHIITHKGNKTAYNPLLSNNVKIHYYIQQSDCNDDMFDNIISDVNDGNGNNLLVIFEGVSSIYRSGVTWGYFSSRIRGLLAKKVLIVLGSSSAPSIYKHTFEGDDGKSLIKTAFVFKENNLTDIVKLAKMFNVDAEIFRSKLKKLIPLNFESLVINVNKHEIYIRKKNLIGEYNLIRA